MTKPVDVEKFLKREFKKRETGYINISIPLDTHTKLKVRAAEEGKTLGGLTTEILDKFLKKKGKNVHGEQNS